MTAARIRSALLVVCAAVLFVFGVAAAVDLAGGPDPLGEVGGIVWGVMLVGFGVLTVSDSEEQWIRVLGVVTAFGGLMFLIATAGAAVA